MAASTSLDSLLNPAPPLSLRRQPSPVAMSPLRVTCGPRDNRGPLVRGRTLSTEAILAIQALKRSVNDSSKLDHIISHGPFSRLVKSDLLASLAELQRQGHWRLALKLFAAVRRETWYQTDYAVYAQMISALAKAGATTEIDGLMADLAAEQAAAAGGPSAGDVRGIARLVRALLVAERGKDVGEVYRVMKRKGCVPDEYLFRVLGRGLRRVGEEAAADEVEKDFKAWREAEARAAMMLMPV